MYLNIYIDIFLVILTNLFNGFLYDFQFSASFVIQQIEFQQNHKYMYTYTYIVSHSLKILTQCIYNAKCK